MNLILFGGLYDEFNIFKESFVYSRSFLKPHRLLYDALRNENYEIIHIRDVVNFEDIRDKVSGILIYDLPYKLLNDYGSYFQMIKYNILKLKRKYLVVNKKYEMAMDLPVKKILVLWESPSVYPANYLTKNHLKFDLILTQNDSIIDNLRYKKIFQPVYHNKLTEPKLSWSKLKFSCLINSNKKTKYAGELYSERRSLVSFMQENYPQLLEVWGSGWNDYSMSKGRCIDKLDILRNYKFCFCYENSNIGPGFITEKIFDCFASGTVPVYLGPDNVNHLLPSNLFIDRRSFPTNEDLIKYLIFMPESTYIAIQNEIFSYFRSSDFASKWSVDSYINRIKNAIGITSRAG